MAHRSSSRHDAMGERIHHGQDTDHRAVAALAECELPAALIEYADPMPSTTCSGPATRRASSWSAPRWHACRRGRRSRLLRSGGQPGPRARVRRQVGSGMAACSSRARQASSSSRGPGRSDRSSTRGAGMRVHIGGDHAAFEPARGPGRPPARPVTTWSTTVPAYDAQDDYPVYVLRAAEAVAADPQSRGSFSAGPAMANRSRRTRSTASAPRWRGHLSWPVWPGSTTTRKSSRSAAGSPRPRSPRPSSTSSSAPSSSGHPAPAPAGHGDGIRAGRDAATAALSGLSHRRRPARLRQAKLT